MVSWTIALVLTSALEASSDPDFLSRSLYVPLELRVCEHLRGATLYRGEEPLRILPGTQVFQFTYFRSLGRIEPDLERVRVEGLRDGESFRTELVITPASVYVGNKKIDLDLDAQMARLRRSIDARHETVEITLRCSRACPKSADRDSRSAEAR